MFGIIPYESRLTFVERARMEIRKKRNAAAYALWEMLTAATMPTLSRPIYQLPLSAMSNHIKVRKGIFLKTQHDY